MSVDSCAEIRSAPSMVQSVLTESGEGAGKRYSECAFEVVTCSKTEEQKSSHGHIVFKPIKNHMLARGPVPTSQYEFTL